MISKNFKKKKKKTEIPLIHRSRLHHRSLDPRELSTSSRNKKLLKKEEIRYKVEVNKAEINFSPFPQTLPANTEIKLYERLNYIVEIFGDWR